MDRAASCGPIFLQYFSQCVKHLFDKPDSLCYNSTIEFIAAPGCLPAERSRYYG